MLMPDSRKKDSWWEDNFTPEEQALIEGAFQPLGSISARSMVEADDPGAIGNLVGHLKKEHLRHLGYRLLDRADALIDDDVPVIRRHFYYHAAGDFLYRWRDIDRGAMERAVSCFEKQIALGQQAMRAFLDAPDFPIIPAHAGYRQLRIIEEKRGNLARARALCLQAKAEGWADDWDKQIATIDKKIAKASKG